MKMQEPAYVTLALVLSIAGMSVAQELAHQIPPGFPTDVRIVPGGIVVRPASAISSDESTKQMVLARVQQLRQQGWAQAAPGRHESFLAHFKEQSSSGPKQMKLSLDELAGKLKVAPADLRGTLLDGFKLHGAWSAGGFVNGGWTGIVRSGTSPRLGRVVLEEYDYVQAGSFFVIPEELVAFNANGLPAQFIVYRDSGGASWTEVRWFTANKEFRLLIDRPISKSESEYLALQGLATRLH
jgi:hypothetical protein